MKKLSFIITIIICCFLFTGCSRISTINLSKLEKMMDNEETFMLEIVRTDCTHCQSFTPKFNDVLKENKLKSYRIYKDKLSAEESSKFDSIIYASATPMVVFIKDGKPMESHTKIEGDIARSAIYKKIKAAGFIKN